MGASGVVNELVPSIIRRPPELRFDWPMLRIGVAEYAEGPTGVTVFRFGRKVLGAVDALGGAPGTVNTDFLRLGYETPELDAVVFAGGSWYGLETVTAVASALKDAGERDGTASLFSKSNDSYQSNIALSVGAIIYDLGGRRLNEIVPDKRLAEAAVRSAVPGSFPLGAQGAGRFAKTGYYFGCNAYSGQGGAYRAVGGVKIAAFTVVNAYGLVVKRNGQMAAGYRDPAWPSDITPSELLRSVPESRRSGWSRPGEGSPRNTTVSLIVTNAELSPAELQRVAAQTHSSMARAIQPFGTQFDGDVLFAVSTGEISKADAGGIQAIDIGTIGAELMWDAVLNSVPEQPRVIEPSPAMAYSAREMERACGDYVFRPFAALRISIENDEVLARSIGKRDVYEIGAGRATAILPVSGTEFTVPGRYPLVLSFGRPGHLIINPGHWEQVGRLITGAARP